MTKPKFSRSRPAPESESPVAIDEAPAPIAAAVSPAPPMKLLIDDPGYAARQSEVDRLENELGSARAELASADRIEANNIRRGVLAGHELVAGAAAGETVPDRQPMLERLVRLSNAIALAKKLRDAEAVNAGQRLRAIAAPQLEKLLAPIAEHARALRDAVAAYRAATTGFEFDIGEMPIAPAITGDQGDLSFLIRRLAERQI